MLILVIIHLKDILRFAKHLRKWENFPSFFDHSILLDEFVILFILIYQLRDNAIGLLIGEN